MTQSDDLAARRAQLTPAKRAIFEKWQRGEHTDIGRPAPLPRRLSTTAPPLTFAQQQLWLIDQLEPGNAAYNIPNAVRLAGRIDTTALEASLNEVVRRHESLRTTIRVVDGQPAQIIAPTLTLSLPLTDLEAIPAPEREAHVRELIRTEARRSFGLSSGPLIRAQLLQLQPDDHVLLITVHHIICDGWSMGMLIDEMVTLYGAFSTGRASPLSALAIQFADYAVWQRDWFQGEVLEKQLRYWTEQLKGAPAALALPTDRPRPAVQTFNGHALYFQLPATLAERIKALSRQEGTTLFMTFLAAFQTLLARYSHQDDVVVGNDVASRNRSEIQSLIGMFVNTIVLRSDLSGNPTFRELLGRVRQVALDAYAHQDLPLEVLVNTLQTERNLSRQALFQVLFSFLDLAKTQPLKLAERIDLPGVRLSEMEMDSGSAKFDMELILREDADGLTGQWEYNTDLFDRATISRMIGHFQTLLVAIAADPDQRIGDLPLLTPEELAERAAWNAVRQPFALDQTYSALFEAQAACTPGAAAVVCGDQQRTYDELRQQVETVAHQLREHGVGPERVVAILAERSIEFLVTILAIFRAGGAYMPLDPHAPPARLHQVLAQSDAVALITTAAFEQAGGELQQALADSGLEHLRYDQLIAAPSPDAPLPIRSGPANLAYIIYTSGSTGVPKGAMVEQQGMINHLFAKISELELTGADRVVQNASQMFDISVWQFLAALVVGGTTQIFPDAISHDPIQLLQQVEATGCTILEVVPSLLRLMLEHEARHGADRPQLRALRWLVPTGEVLTPALCRQWLRSYSHVPLLNAYGPTECSDDVAHYRVAQPPAPEVLNVPIGHPLPNLSLTILDAALQPVPIGVTGELYVGGIQVGRGYLNRPELTAERFVPNPFLRMEDGGWRMDERHPPSSILHPPSSRLYKTGDLARYRPDGAIEFLGRIDQQIKLRGFRIELQEIEAALQQHPAVRHAAVILHDDRQGAQQLVAYVVPSQEQRTTQRVPDKEQSIENQEPPRGYPTKNHEPGDPTEGSQFSVLGSEDGSQFSILNSQFSIQELRAYLKERLPDYMIPSLYVQLAAMPLTPNGKVDRRALPEPSGEHLTHTATFVAPETPTEIELAEIWRELLRVDVISVHDSFFDLGGNSLLGTQFVFRVWERFGVELALRDIFSDPTIRTIAALLEAALLDQANPAELDEMLDLLRQMDEEEIQQQLDGDEPAARS